MWGKKYKLINYNPYLCSMMFDNESNIYGLASLACNTYNLSDNVLQFYNTLP